MACDRQHYIASCALYTRIKLKGVTMDEFKAFMALSQALTGITSLATIEPKSLTETIAKDYLHRLKEQFGCDFVALLTLYDAKSGTSDPLAALLADPSFKDSINLYIVGSSVFATAATANPTLTLAALTLRIARAIHRQLQGGLC